ncbi:hypothetical protein VOLCADRAFT_99769 [Volvox carteri f. nagariensis]|uniref:Uncharacterized protein n=1 Tax=Volvox carteri f. nagariensis TaxID=3068 RepID=D8UIL5_VOLCA|nr:uncharacterized protein VOLCADRAFT_99769 [Volvox carteri f. nagariensis]EFJ40416.1 hypothetical protein VOLCADRAFT_99769 [Volvox carteri f. nagariensis]|eukprot:XP_002958496.1 hypothetical protein VOLCADRAFT_99769 [Volvox carteri f. nagariensis]
MKQALPISISLDKLPSDLLGNIAALLPLDGGKVFKACSHASMASMRRVHFSPAGIAAFARAHAPGSGPGTSPTAQQLVRFVCRAKQNGLPIVTRYSEETRLKWLGGSTPAQVRAEAVLLLLQAGEDEKLQAGENHTEVQYYALLDLLTDGASVAAAELLRLLPDDEELGALAWIAIFWTGAIGYKQLPPKPDSAAYQAYHDNLARVAGVAAKCGLVRLLPDDKMAALGLRKMYTLLETTLCEDVIVYEIDCDARTAGFCALLLHGCGAAPGAAAATIRVSNRSDSLLLALAGTAWARPGAVVDAQLRGLVQEAFREERRLPAVGAPAAPLHLGVGVNNCDITVLSLIVLHAPAH